MPKHYIKKPLKKLARKSGKKLAEIEQARMLGHQYKAEAKKLLEMSKHQFQTLDSLIKELASDMVEASGPDENHESCSSDDE